MKRLVLLVVWAVAAVGGLFLTNCSGPLESADNPAPARSDTIFIVDTLFNADTIILVDTLVVTDTTILADTVMLVDTVIVVQIDTLILPMTYCGRLSSDRREIVWLLQNPEGSYGLEFAAEVDHDQPIQKLHVEVDGHEYVWEPADDNRFVVEQNLDEDSSVRVSSGSPHACGHAIDICLTVTAY